MLNRICICYFCCHFLLRVLYFILKLLWYSAPFTHCASVYGFLPSVLWFQCCIQPKLTGLEGSLIQTIVTLSGQWIYDFEFVLELFFECNFYSSSSFPFYFSLISYMEKYFNLLNLSPFFKWTLSSLVTILSETSLLDAFVTMDLG